MGNAMFMSNVRKYEVQRMNNFEIYITDLGKDVVPLAVESFSLPDTTISPIELAYGNTKVKVAGLPDVADSTLVVKDFIEPDIENLVYDWYEKVYDHRSGDIGWAADYKKNGTFYMFAPDWTERRSWKLIGIWPSTMTLGDWNYEDGAKRQISITLQVDQVYRDA